jgi:hypothetical protein
VTPAAGRVVTSESGDDSALYEQPLEFAQSMTASGYCDGQAIVPSADGDHYDCWCSCGAWRIEAKTMEEGLLAARVHTGSVSA